MKKNTQIDRQFIFKAAFSTLFQQMRQLPFQTCAHLEVTKIVMTEEKLVTSKLELDIYMIQRFMPLKQKDEIHGSIGLID